MDSIKKIAIANIVSLLVSGNIIETNNNSLWEEILSCSGQRKLYEKYKECLTPHNYHKGEIHIFQNKNPQFKEFYNGLYGVINSIYSNGSGMNELTELLKIIIDKIKLSKVFKIDELKYWDINEYMRNLNEEEYNEFIVDNFSKDFKKFIRCLNILSLDIKYKNEEIFLYQYNRGVSDRLEDVYSVEQWLHDSIPHCEESYNDALNNYAEGRYGSCISDCRVTVTGLFTNFKETSNWFDGIHQIDSNYKNPKNINEPNKMSKIIKDKSNGNYPRFRAIYNIYAMFCDLGAHRNEGEKNNNEIILENVNIYDALLSLRLTEDILIWAMNTIKME